MTQSLPVFNLPFKYIEGLQISNNATAPNTILDITAGRCRDSNDAIDLAVGASNANLTGGTVSAPISVNTAVNGVNGLDTGTIANSTVYAVYIIGDSHYYQQTAGLLSLATSAVPTLPTEYDSYRLIGYIVIDGSGNIRAGSMSGNGATRRWTFDDDVEVISAGADTSFADVSLASTVPPVASAIVGLNSNFQATGANELLSFTKYNLSVAQFQCVSIVAAGTAPTLCHSQVLTGLNSGVPTIRYSVSAGTVTSSVSYFEISL